MSKFHSGEGENMLSILFLLAFSLKKLCYVCGKSRRLNPYYRLHRGTGADTQSECPVGHFISLPQPQPPVILNFGASVAFYSFVFGSKLFTCVLEIKMVNGKEFCESL